MGLPTFQFVFTFVPNKYFLISFGAIKTFHIFSGDEFILILLTAIKSFFIIFYFLLNSDNFNIVFQFLVVAPIFNFFSKKLLVNFDLWYFPVQSMNTSLSTILNLSG